MISHRLTKIREGVGSPKVVFVFLIAAISMLGWVIMRGIYIGPDSLTYLRTAELFFSDNHHLASVQFPPLYPILLKLMMSLGASDPVSAKLLNSLFWFASFSICFHIFSCIRPIQKNKALFFSFLLMSSYVVFSTYTQMMSESLFICLVFLNIALLHAYVRERTLGLLVLASFIASLSALSRYAGVAVMISTLITLLWNTPDRSLKQWFKTCVLWGLSSALFGFWILRNNILYGTFTGREVVRHDRVFEGAFHYLEILSRLYFPQALPESLRIILFSGIISAIVVGLFYLLLQFRKKFAVDKSTLILVGIVLTLLSAQTALLVVALFVDPFLPIQQRILTPIYTLLLLLHFLLIAHFFISARVQHIAAIYTGLFLLLNLSRLIAHEVKVDDFKYGYASAPYVNSPLVKFMKTTTPNAVVCSNGDDAMSWHLKRFIQPIPKQMNPRTNRKNSSFDRELATLYCELKASNGYLVYFNIIDWRDYLPTLETIKKNYPFVTVKQTFDGTILQTPENDTGQFCNSSED